MCAVYFYIHVELLYLLINISQEQVPIYVVWWHTDLPTLESLCLQAL